jgi:hypothetical protein
MKEGKSVYNGSMKHMLAENPELYESLGKVVSERNATHQ